MNGCSLGNVSMEKDLRVVISGDSKNSKQTAAVARRASMVLELIKRNFCRYSNEIVLKLNRT